MKTTLALIAIISCFALAMSTDLESEQLQRELAERELQKTLCYARMRDVTMLAKECTWTPETDVYSLKVYMDRDLSICFGDNVDNNDEVNGVADATQYMNKRAFFWSAQNNHVENRMLPYSSVNQPNVNGVCQLTYSADQSNALATDIFTKCDDLEDPETLEMTESSTLEFMKAHGKIDGWEYRALFIPEKAAHIGPELADITATESGSQTDPDGTGLQWAYTDCKAEEKLLKDCTTCGCCVEDPNAAGTYLTETTSSYTCEYAWNRGMAEYLSWGFAPFLENKDCTCTDGGETNPDDYDTQVFQLVQVYNFNKEPKTSITLSRWFETALTAKIYRTLTVQLAASVTAVEIKDTPCECAVEVKHNAVMDFIEERVFLPNGNLKECSSPGHPDCQLDFHEYGLYPNPSVETNYNADGYNHVCYKSDDNVNGGALAAFPGDAEAALTSSYPGGCVNWKKVRKGAKAKFPTLQTVLMRIQLKGAANRALDLIKLEAVFTPTGGSASDQSTLWDGSAANAGGMKDVKALGVQVWWDGREGYKQINIAIPNLDIGSAENLFYQVQLRVCEVGSKTRETVEYDELRNSWDFCDSGDGTYQESSAFRSDAQRLRMRRRILQDNPEGDKEALLQTPSPTTDFEDCGSEQNTPPNFDQDCYNKYVETVNAEPVPTDTGGEATTEEGSGLLVAVAAVVVFSVAIGAGAVMYSKGMFGGSGNKDAQAPSNQN